MEDLPEDLRSFLQKHPCFQLTDSKKIRCGLNAHEFPCSLAELQLFTAGNKYKKLRAQDEFDYSQYEPHIVRSTKQPDHLFCKLTLRHINRVPQHVVRHASGRRYRRALEQYEECVRQGVAFVPVQLKQKKRPKEREEAAGSEGRATGSERRASRKQDSGICTLSSSEDSDSSDSMSDLYPPSVFTEKKPDDEQKGSDAEEDDFQTDDDDDEDVSEMEVENQMQKRKKVQSAGFTKKFKKKKGFKHVGKVNGK